MDPPHVQSTLPFDIFSEVIGHLDVEKDIPTLRSLSTTCATLLEPSQRMIFSTISIKMVSPAPDGLRPEYLALKDLLITSPHLATYVSHLKLSFAIPHSDTLIVTSVVERLVALKSLHLQNMANDGSYPEQNSEWRAFIGQVLQQPSLLRLKVDGSGQLPCSIWYLPALMSIELGKWRIKEADPLATPYPTLSRRLAINWVDFSQIETLERFLRASPRLRELDLHLPASSMPIFLFYWNPIPCLNHYSTTSICRAVRRTHQRSYRSIISPIPQLFGGVWCHWSRQPFRWTCARTRTTVKLRAKRNPNHSIQHSMPSQRQYCASPNTLRDLRQWRSLGRVPASATTWHQTVYVVFSKPRFSGSSGQGSGCGFCGGNLNRYTRQIFPGSEPSGRRIWPHRLLTTDYISNAHRETTKYGSRLVVLSGGASSSHPYSLAYAYK